MFEIHKVVFLKVKNSSNSSEGKTDKMILASKWNVLVALKKWNVLANFMNAVNSFIVGTDSEGWNLGKND